MSQKIVSIGMLALVLAGGAAPAASADESAGRDHALALDRLKLDELERALGAEEKIDRMRAVQDLGARAVVGRETPRVEALLRTAVADADPDVASQARLELARLEGVDLIPAAVREEHSRALARAELEELEESLRSPDALARLRAVQFLSSTGKDSVGEARFRSLLEAARGDDAPLGRVGRGIDRRLVTLQLFRPLRWSRLLRCSISLGVGRSLRFSSPNTSKNRLVVA